MSGKDPKQLSIDTIAQDADQKFERGKASFLVQRTITIFDRNDYSIVRQGSKSIGAEVVSRRTHGYIFLDSTSEPKRSAAV